MSSEQISPEEARAALAQVAGQRATVRSADLDRWALVALAALQVGYGLVIGFVGPGRFSLLWDVGIVATMGGFGIWREWRQRVFSRRGQLIYWAALLSYVGWVTLLVFGVAPKLGLTGSGPDLRYVVLSALSVVPLLAGAALIGRGR